MRAMETASGAGAMLAGAGAWLGTYGATPESTVAALIAASLAVVELRNEEARPMLLTVFGVNAGLGVFASPVVVDYLQLDHAGAVIVAAFVLGFLGHNALVAALRALSARLGGERK